MISTSLQLPVQIYDGIWIDCVVNHLLAILSKQNPSYMNMNLNLRRNYSVCRSKMKGELSEAFIHQAVYPGFLVLEVGMEMPNFGNAVLSEDFGPFPDHELHDLIRGSIRDGHYVFIKLDRYFIEGSKNFGIDHWATVALIYGYDDDRRQYFILNDHRLSRTYEDLELSYDTVYQAYHESTDMKPIFFHARITEEAKKANIRISKEKIRRNLLDLLHTNVQLEESCEWPGLERVYGIAAIREYAEGFPDYFPHVRIDQLPVVYNGPLDAALLNLQVLDALEKDFLLPAGKGVMLKGMYSELRTMWELYRNQIFLYVTRKKKNAHGVSQTDLSGLQELLFTLHKKEKEAAEAFVDALQFG